MSLQNQLAELVGIQASYTDNSGSTVHTSEKSRDALLRAMGYKPEDDAQTQQDIVRLRDSHWLELISPVVIINAEDEHYSLELTAEQAFENARLYWKITTEKSLNKNLKR